MLPAIFAFCGFYVAGSNQPMFNDATQVVLMRDGTRTVLSMQNNYKGPPEAFAMVVPVPSVLHEGDVKTLSKDLFTHVETMGAPRLVEYWEQDPCNLAMDEGKMGMSGGGNVRLAAPTVTATSALGVKIEAQFTVGEYQIVILSAKDSSGLDTWLRDQKYNIPEGAEPLLRPYVESGSKFFVAKVDPKKVVFEDGRAALSPLRFYYDTDQFSLPIRLGLANSQGTQDLIVNILAKDRYEVSNYPNVTIPTNIDLQAGMKDKFAGFYAALFDATVEKHPGSVVTEYAWAAGSCDPCPGADADAERADDTRRGCHRIEGYVRADPDAAACALRQRHHERSDVQGRGADHRWPRAARCGRQARERRAGIPDEQLSGPLRDPPRVDGTADVHESDARDLGRSTGWDPERAGQARARPCIRRAGQRAVSDRARASGFADRSRICCVSSCADCCRLGRARSSATARDEKQNRLRMCCQRP